MLFFDKSKYKILKTYDNITNFNYIIEIKQK